MGPIDDVAHMCCRYHPSRRYVCVSGVRSHRNKARGVLLLSLLSLVRSLAPAQKWKVTGLRPVATPLTCFCCGRHEMAEINTGTSGGIRFFLLSGRESNKEKKRPEQLCYVYSSALRPSRMLTLHHRHHHHHQHPIPSHTHTHTLNGLILLI